MSEIKPVPTGQQEITPINSVQSAPRSKKPAGIEGPKDQFVKSKAMKTSQMAAQIPLKAQGIGGNEPLSFSRINTPLAALATPILDPGILSALRATALDNMNLQVNGSITQGNSYNRVNLSFRQRIPYQTGQAENAKEINYRIDGFLGMEGVHLDAQYSNSALMVNGSIGQNQVWLRSKYVENIKTFDTSGNIGDVPVFVHSTLGDDNIYMRGTLGGDNFRQELSFNGNDSRTYGSLGNKSINGTARQETYGNEDVPRRFSTSNYINDVAINYNIDVEGVKGKN